MPRAIWIAILLTAMNPMHDADAASSGKSADKPAPVGKVEKTDAEWKKQLSAGNAPSRPTWTKSYLVPGETPRLRQNGRFD